MNIQREHNLFDQVVDHSNAHIAVIDNSGTIVYTNDAWNKFALENGASTTSWIGVNYIEVCRKSEASGERMCHEIVSAFESLFQGESINYELEYPCHSNTKMRWFLMRAIPIVIKDVRYICVYHERFVGDTQLRASQKRLSLATEAGQIGIWELDLNTNQLIWDQWMYRIYGVSQDDFSGAYKTWFNGVHPDDINRIEKALDFCIENKLPFDSEFRVVRPNGEIRHVVAKAQIFYDEDENASQMIGVNIDITERKIAEKKARQLALFDPLTGLPNRTLIQDRLVQQITSSSRTTSYGALLFIDIDHFKLVNDTAGHEVGDELIIQVASRLKLELRESDSLGRFGGDEFVVILSNLSSSKEQALSQARQIGESLVSSFNKPFSLSIGSQQITSSIGLTLFNSENDDPGVILRQADLAMYKAKGTGRNRIHFFAPEMQKVLERRVLLEKEMNFAIERNEFSVYFQPQYHIDGHLEGAEALLRWNSPTLGNISPMEFIPVAEDTGMIIEIDNWVLKQSCIQLKQWQKLGLSNQFKIAVNVSARQLFAADFVPTIERIITEQQVNIKQIKLELTESLLVKNVKEAIEKMTILRESGISFSIDDFGTGYSSLAYLQKLPLDQLKIDKSFVDNILEDTNEAAIVKTVITLAQSLNISVIAEGVETEGQRQKLVEFGCFSFQGYLYSPAVPSSEFVQFLNLKN